MTLMGTKRQIPCYRGYHTGVREGEAVHLCGLFHTYG